MQANLLLDPALLAERIATHCVCCGGARLARSPAILMPFVANRAFGWEPVEITPEWGLRDIRTGMAYPLCNSLQCADCGIVFLDIRFTDAEMAALYSGYRGREYTALRERFEPGYAERAVIIQRGSTHVARVEAFLSAHVTLPVRVLDWGGDTGFNTPFRTRAELLHIYDISNQPVVDGAVRVDKPAVERTHYDLIVLSHVLEHLPHPARTVAEIATIMTPETVLYVELPHEDLMSVDTGAADRHARKKYWHEHINFYAYASLEALLAHCGLQVSGTQSIEVDGGGKSWQIFSIACKLRTV